MTTKKKAGAHFKIKLLFNNKFRAKSITSFELSDYRIKHTCIVVNLSDSICLTAGPLYLAGTEVNGEVVISTQQEPLTYFYYLTSIPKVLLLSYKSIDYFPNQAFQLPQHKQNVPVQDSRFTGTPIGSTRCRQWPRSNKGRK